MLLKGQSAAILMAATLLGVSIHLASTSQTDVTTPTIIEKNSTTLDSGDPYK